MAFAQSSQTSQEKTKKNFFKLKEGDQVFRILPAWGSLANNPKKWNQFYAVHFGYKGTDGKMFVFNSPEVMNWNTRMVEVADPAKRYIEQLVAASEKARVENNTEMQAKIKAKLDQYSLDKKYYMNVVDLNGNVGVLAIGKRMKDALEVLINEQKNKGVDIISPNNGRFVVFSRSGTGRNTIHQVRLYKQQRDIGGGVIADVDLVHKLDETFDHKVQANGFDLASIYVTPTAEEVEDMVKNGAPAVDRVRARYYTKKEKAQTTETAMSGSLDEEDVPNFTAPAPQATESAPKARPLPPVTDDALFAELGL